MQLRLLVALVVLLLVLPARQAYCSLVVQQPMLERVLLVAAAAVLRDRMALARLHRLRAARQPTARQHLIQPRLSQRVSRDVSVFSGTPRMARVAVPAARRLLAPLQA
jgi:hypothetical protein